MLSDPQKRSNYDTLGYAYNDGGFGNGQQGGYNFNQEDIWSMFGGGGRGERRGNSDDIFEMFSEMFGGYRQPQQEPERKGEDLFIEVTVNRKDLGTTRVLEYDIQDACSECKGEGVARGYKITTCQTCKGAGQVRRQARSGFGVFPLSWLVRLVGAGAECPKKNVPLAKAGDDPNSARPLKFVFH